MDSKIRAELQELQALRAADSSLSVLTVVLEMETTQSVAEGIHLNLEIANGGVQTVDLVNPLDFLSAGILLLDHEGYPIELPPVSPRLLVHVGRGDNPNRLRLPFQVVSFSAAGRELLETEREAKSFALIGGEHLRIGLTLNQMMPIKSRAGTSAQSTCADARRPIQIPAGDYQIQVTISLVAPTNGHNARTLRSEQINVHLKAT